MDRTLSGSKISSICFVHLCRLPKLCHLLDAAKMHDIVSTLIISRIDYWNTVFAGLPAMTLACSRQWSDSWIYIVNMSTTISQLSSHFNLCSATHGSMAYLEPILTLETWVLLLEIQNITERPGFKRAFKSQFDNLAYHWFDFILKAPMDDIGRCKRRHTNRLPCLLIS